MKANTFFVGLLLSTVAAALPAQEATEENVWSLNLQASEFPETRTPFRLPQRSLGNGEFLIGLPFAEDAQGNPGFVYVPSAVSQNDTWQPPRRMPRTPRIDKTYDYTATFDSEEGEFVVTVSRSEANDGEVLTLTADLQVPRGDVDRYVLVFDRL